MSLRDIEEPCSSSAAWPYLLWRAVDQHDAELDILLQKQRDKTAAKRFFQHLLAQYPDGS